MSGIKYWLFIGALAGLLEVIPYFGAVTGAIPAVILGFQHSLAMGLGLILAFIIINQVEGHIVVPLAMGHSMHLRPLAVLLALLVGEAVAKVVGMIVAVPIIGILRVTWIHGRRYWQQTSPEGSFAGDSGHEAEIGALPPTAIGEYPEGAGPSVASESERTLAAHR